MKVYQLKIGTRFIVGETWQYELLRIGVSGAYVRPLMQKQVTLQTAEGEVSFTRDCASLIISHETECELC